MKKREIKNLIKKIIKEQGPLAPLKDKPSTSNVNVVATGAPSTQATWKVISKKWNKNKLKSPFTVLEPNPCPGEEFMPPVPNKEKRKNKFEKQRIDKDRKEKR